MKQPWRLLFVGFLATSWMSLKLVQCSRPKTTNGIYNTSCYNTSSGGTCFTTFFSNNHLPLRMSFENASVWCKAKVPGSSLVVIKNEEDQHNVKSFLGRQALETETIITDARKLSGSERRNWSWVNGHQIIPRVVADSGGTAAALNFQQKSPAYFPDNAWSKRRYICEYSDSESAYHYKQNNKSYVQSNKTATWYDARKECLRLGGDLASITDLQAIGNWSWLTMNQRYWIGLHRNKWIWNRTEEDSDVLPTEIVVPEEILPSGLFNSINTKEILLILLLLVAVAFIVAAVILVIRKRKYDRRTEGTYMKNITLKETVSSAYTTVVPANNRPSEGTVPPDNTIYAEVEMTKQPTPPSNNLIYASVQPTSEAVDIDKSVVYADLDFPKKDQQKPRSADEISACLNSVYSEPYELATSVSNTEYAEPYNSDK